MARFSKLEVLLRMRETGLVPVFYHPDSEIAQQVMQACYDGGVRVFEFTNRGDFSCEVFASLVKYARVHCPEMTLGIGSIVDEATAALFIQYGANFVVSPCLNERVARLCNRHLIPYAPGCGTVTEVSRAQELGCDVSKIFPAGCVGGPAFVKNLLAPLPWSNIMVTGAVEPTKENLHGWFKAGAMCVGMGSQLFTAEDINNQNWSGISKRCADLLSIIQSL